MRRSIRIRFALLLAVALGAGAPAVVAQDSVPPAAAPASPVERAATEPAATQGAATHGGVPRLAQPTAPRTLRAYWHVFIAFAITWLLLFGYAISLGRRLDQLEQRLSTGPVQPRA